MKEQEDKNSEFLQLLKNSVNLFNRELEKIDKSVLKMDGSILNDLSNSWDNFDEFNDNAKSYIDRYLCYNRSIHEQKSVIYYKGLLNNFRGFESVFSYYDDINKYPNMDLIPETHNQIQTALDNIDKLF